MNALPGNWSEWIPPGGKLVDISSPPSYGEKGMIVFLMDHFYFPYNRYQLERGWEWAAGFWSDIDILITYKASPSNSSTGSRGLLWTARVLRRMEGSDND